MLCRNICSSNSIYITFNYAFVKMRIYCANNERNSEYDVYKVCRGFKMIVNYFVSFKFLSICSYIAWKYLVFVRTHARILWYINIYYLDRNRLTHIYNNIFNVSTVTAHFLLIRSKNLYKLLKNENILTVTIYLYKRHHKIYFMTMLHVYHKTR